LFVAVFLHVRLHEEGERRTTRVWSIQKRELRAQQQRSQGQIFKYDKSDE